MGKSCPDELCSTYCEQTYATHSILWQNTDVCVTIYGPYFIPSKLQKLGSLPFPQKL